MNQQDQSLSPHATLPKKKGLRLWAWVAPLAIALLVGGGFGTWTYLSAQEKAASDTHTTSTAVAQSHATATMQVESASTAVARTNGRSNASLLKAAAANMKAAKSFHLVVNGNQGGQDVKMDGDIDLANDKFRLNISVGDQNTTIISIGSDTYASEDGGKTWKESPTDMSEMLTQFDSLWKQLTPEEIDKAKDALKDGSPKEEKVGDDNTRHITANTKDLASLSASGSSTVEGTIDLWITTSAKPTIRKMIIKTTDTSTSSIDATVEWTKVSESVTIEPPPTSTPEESITRCFGDGGVTPYETPLP